MNRCLFVVLTALGWSALSASGSVTQLFTNAGAITIPASGTGNAAPGAAAAPYPSSINVSGMSGNISNVRVTIRNYSHTASDDVDMLLVGPGGNLMIWSDAGGASTTGQPWTILLDDNAAADLPDTGGIPGGTYRPKNYAAPQNGGSNDNFPSPAPAISANTSFASAFNNTTPNGTWSLYVIDDVGGDIGSIANGWILEVTTGVPALPTTTTLASSLASFSYSTQAVTFTSTTVKTSGGASVGSVGSVTFRENGVALPGSSTVAVTAGQAVYTAPANTFTASNHLIAADYTDASTAYVASSGSVTQVVDRATIRAGNSFYNSALIAIPQGNLVLQTPAQGSPYPSRVMVSNLSGTITKVSVTFSNLSHVAPKEIDALLVGPAGGTQNVIIMSDVGGATTVSGLNLNFDDTAAASLSNPLVSGTFKVTNLADSSDTFFTPAPAVSANTTLAGAFGGINPNGIWTLYIMDAVSGQAGAIAGGWGLTFITSGDAATTTTLTSTQPDYAFIGQSITFTSVVTSAGSPVTAGTVTFKEGASVLAGPMSLNVSGKAIFSTAALAIGDHTIEADYSGSAGSFNLSSATIVQTVDAATLVQGTKFSNPGSVAIPAPGAVANGSPASPYPSHITVSGIPNLLSRVTVTVSNLTHTDPLDIDMLLVGPAGGTQNLVLMSDTGGGNPGGTATLTFDDAAATGLSTAGPFATGTYRPTNAVSGGSDIYPAPAPSASGNLTLNSAFGGINPNGVWRLYVVDDAGGDTGNIANGWSLTICAPPSITASNSVCASSAGNQATSESASTYSWTISNGVITSATNLQTITYTAGASGITTLQLKVNTSSGCTTTNTLAVTIDPPPAAPTITFVPTNLVASFTGNHASGPAGASSYAWSMTNGVITSATNIQTITYTAGVTNNVGFNLRVGNASGCVATGTTNLAIHPPVPPNVTKLTYVPPSSITISGSGNPGSSIAVESSTNLLNWAFRTNLTPDGNGTFQFVEASLTNQARFYRPSPTNQ